MTDLKERLGSIDDVPAPQDWASITSRPPLGDLDTDATMAGFSTDPRANTWKKVATIAAALAIGLAGVVIAVVAISPSPTPPDPGQSSAPLVPQETPIGKDVGRLTFAFGSVWVVDRSGLTRIDPATGKIEAHIPIAGITPPGTQQPFAQYGGSDRGSSVAPASGFLWVTAEPKILGIDPATNTVVRSVIEETGVVNIAAAGDDLVVGGMAEGSGDLRLIDPTNEDDMYLQSRAGFLDAFPQVLATSDWYWSVSTSLDESPAASRWLNDFSGAQLIDVPAIRSMTEAGGAVWMTSEDSLYRIGAEVPDRLGGQLKTIEPDLSLPLDAPSIVAGDGTSLWMLQEGDEGSSLTRLDPQTGQAVSPGQTLAHPGPAEMIVVAGRPWITYRDDGVLVELAADLSGLDAVARSDALIEERTRAITAQIISSMSATENTDWSVVWPLMQERSAVCEQLLVQPEAEHSQYVQDACESQIQAAREDAGSSSQPTIGELAYLYRMNGESAIGLLNVAQADSSRQLGDRTFPVSSLSWSPDGGSLAIDPATGIDTAKIQILSTRTGRLQRTIAVGDHPAQVRWSPDGDTIAYHTRTGALRLLRFKTEEEVDLGVRATDSCWSPDGERLAFVATNGDFGVIEVATGKGSTLVTRADVSSCSWSPDGEEIAISEGGAASQVYIVDSSSGVVTPLTEVEGGPSDVTWSPDGEWIAFLAADGEQIDVFAVSHSTRAIVRLTDDGELETSLAWGPAP